MTQIDLRAISTSVMPKLLYWTSAVVVITLLGYPGIICITPLGWLLATHVGTQVRYKSAHTGRVMIMEAFLAGAVLGTFQGLVISLASAIAPNVDPRMATGISKPHQFSAAAAIVGAPIAGGIATLAARKAAKRSR